ncbi:hypothetical protein [Nonomuraea sp. GTA35]|uniref:hypothetical protein n=1 Tax=Nonomuraea sp. GTA35 TaxID=1676746 RepID=UPI0035C18394
MLWDDETLYELTTRLIRLARDAGALSTLATALNFHSTILVQIGDLARAAGLVADVAAILIDAYAPQAAEPVLLKAAVHHAVEFPTWQSLIRRQGLQPEVAVTLLTRMIESTTPEPDAVKP